MSKPLKGVVQDETKSSTTLVHELFLLFQLFLSQVTGDEPLYQTQAMYRGGAVGIAFFLILENAFSQWFKKGEIFLSVSSYQHLTLKGSCQPY